MQNEIQTEAQKDVSLYVYILCNTSLTNPGVGDFNTYNRWRKMNTKKAHSESANEQQFATAFSLARLPFWSIFIKFTYRISA